MRLNYEVPGVYRQDFFLRPEVGLPTGIPGFVGFADAASYDEKGVVTWGKPAFNQAVELHRKDDFEGKFRSHQFAADSGSERLSYLADAVNGFFLNGGARCYVVFADWQANLETALSKAIDVLGPLNDIDLIAIPDAMAVRLPDGKLDTGAITRLQKEMLKHCDEHRGRLAILDSLPGQTAKAVIQQRATLNAGLSEPVNGALYYPWVKISNDRLVPPCGHVAGVFARSDARVGVFKAPANEELLGVLDLELPVDNQAQSELNPQNINCLRATAGRGIRVWGARTISSDPNWRYVNVRRTVLTLQRWIDANMSWANFEPNTPRLWVRIKRELSSYLNALWQAGALAGQTPEQAFYIKCDAETNPSEVREAGQTVTEIGLAPSAPAEFIVVRVIHHTGVEPR